MTIRRPSAVETTECDREPIHVPGSIQPHGFLLALHGPGGRIRHASDNAAAFLGLPGEGRVLGARLEDLFGPKAGRSLDAALGGLTTDGSPHHLGTVAPPRGDGRGLTAIGHQFGGLTILEFEPTPPGMASGLESIYPLTNSFAARLQAAADADELNSIAAAEIRRLTGFDRVLVYRFDADGHGTVVAEDRNDVLPTYLGHRFPASDVPKQARELYRLNRLRLIADACYRPVPIRPAHDPETGRPIDLTYAAMRSVSPVHLEYMRNMGTAASMSISILRDGELWGLLSCHHARPRAVPFLVRAACEFMGQVLSLQLSAKEHDAQFERTLELKSLQARLLAAMAGREDYRDGLASEPDGLLTFAGATGAAIVSDDRCTRIGVTPDESPIRRLAGWLTSQGSREIFHTETLARTFPEASAYADRAAGVLAIAISKLHPSYVLWFRPEAAQTVRWAGDPNKPATTADGLAGLRPRTSFALWRETVRGRARPFHAAEVEAAAELRNAIIGIVLRQAEELAELSGELARSNKELEAFSYSVSHDLRAPFRHIVGYAEMLRDHAGEKLDAEERRYVATIVDSAAQAGKLVDSLLAFSRMGRARLNLRPVDMNELVEEARQEAMRDAAGRRVRWGIGPLPRFECDVMMLRQLLENLFSNALKFTRARDEAVIEIRAETADDEHVFSVKDNGIGFDMTYYDKLFGVFQRLHRMEDFEGTGIGLANVRRIAARHGGRAWAESAVDRGATFYFTLPEQPIRSRPESDGGGR